MCNIEIGKIYLTRGGYFCKVISNPDNSGYCRTHHYHYDDEYHNSGVLTRSNRVEDGLWSSASITYPDHRDIVWGTKALDVIWDFNHDDE